MTGITFSGGAAVVTGAGSGIGAAVAARAAHEGMNVLLADIDLGAAEAAAELLRAGGVDAVARRLDVRDSAAVEDTARFAFERWGGVRLLVNNAGVESHGRLWELSIEQWDRVIDVNLNGVFYGLRAFIPRMIAAGERSHIVNVASVAALYSRPLTAPYGASKHATLVLTEGVAAELADATDLITVSAVLPGAVSTAIFENAVSADDDGIGERDRLALVERLRRDGISPDQAAQIIFSGISENRLLIHTDTQMSAAAIEQRAASLRDSVA